jgi:DNA-binding transcriptional ArsR family regulator
MVVNSDLDRTFAALADPTRRAILEQLALGDATVKVGWRAPFKRNLQATFQHLKVLGGAGLITRGRDAQFRPTALAEAPLEDAITWIDRNLRTRRTRLPPWPGFQPGGDGAS